MIAVTFALPSESSGFIRRLDRKRTLRAPFRVTGECGGESVSILHTGVGEKAARAKLASYLEAETPRLLISSGFAGALQDSWRPGDLLLAENLSAGHLYAAAQAALPESRRGKLMTVHEIVDSASSRADLARTFYADAVDMESEQVAKACAERGIPMLSLRAISDTPVAPFPAPPAVLFDIERQRTNPIRLFSYLAQHPSALPKFITFARQVAAARAALANALCLLISSGCLR